MRMCEVPGQIEELYSRVQYLKEDGGLREYKESSSRIGRENECRSQKIRKDRLEDRNFRREELLENYTTKILYKWNDGKFEAKYLRNLERNQQRQKFISLEKKS